MHHGYCLSNALDIEYALYSLHLFTLYAHIFTEHFSIEEWFSYHKFMYFGPCATGISRKNMIKHSVESY